MLHRRLILQFQISQSIVHASRRGQILQPNLSFSSNWVFVCVSCITINELMLTSQAYISFPPSVDPGVLLHLPLDSITIFTLSSPTNTREIGAM